jgi:hypothetical protein
MPVYIDDMQRRARVGRLDAVWSHLMADTHDELVDFARRLGLNTRWIQHEGKPLEHFDVTEPKRQAALRLGAVPIRYGAEGAALTRAKREGVPFDLEAARADIAARRAEREAQKSAATEAPVTNDALPHTGSA